MTNPERQTDPRVRLHDARAGLRSIDLYAESSGGSAGCEALFQDCLKRFYELASSQLSERVIDARLFAHGEETTLHDIIVAIDTELASYTRSGLVQSQVEPFADFIEALRDLQDQILSDEELDPALRLRIERQLFKSQEAS